MDKIRLSFNPEGTCVKNFIYDVHKDENGDFVFDELRTFGGKCSASAQILNRLANGKKIKELIPQFKEIVCSQYNSCFGELAKAFEQFLQQQENATPIVVSHKRKRPLEMDRE